LVPNINHVYITSLCVHYHGYIWSCVYIAGENISRVEEIAQLEVILVSSFGALGVATKDTLTTSSGSISVQFIQHEHP